jgi:hypothetical protein
MPTVDSAVAALNAKGRGKDSRPLRSPWHAAASYLGAGRADIKLAAKTIQGGPRTPRD